MTLRPPLVIVDGQTEQLHVDDRILDRTKYLFLEADATMVAGQLVYIKTNGHIDKACANSGTTTHVLGLLTAAVTSGQSQWVQTSGVLVLTTSEWDVVAADIATGLAIGSEYFLDDTNAGQMIGDTLNDTTGSFAVSVGHAISATRFNIRPTNPLLL